MSANLTEVFDPIGGDLIAIIVGKSSGPHGITFVTKDDSVHQLGLLRWPAGHIVDAHVHNKIERNIDSTQEVLFVREGKVRADLYSEDQRYIGSHVLVDGDVIFLVSGGHGFEIIEEADIVEVKQGPYTGETEKTRFKPPPHTGLS